MSLSFTPQARDDLVAIRDWIAEDDVCAADHVVARIVETACALARLVQMVMTSGNFPMFGRIGAVDGTREYSVAGLPYVVVFRIVSETELDLLAILHARRKYPPA